ncbi:hypothetical protein ACFUTX_13455 [Microbacterium sp. NPDC057407]|uniref:hypothetical protein n=1 Tax=Microbacterium sp. NPDC057407 TaxID=3346120 RepID=UPI00366B7957
MASPLDQVFELLPEVVEGYLDQDRTKKRIRVRAADRRIVTVYFSPAVVSAGLKKAEDLAWFGDRGWSPARRWVALTSIHIDESINGLTKADAYRQRAGGFDPVDPTTTFDEFDATDFDGPGSYFRQGDNRYFDATGAT